MKPTFRPSKIRRARKFGYRARKATHAGRKILAARRAKGRAIRQRIPAKVQLDLPGGQAKQLRHPPLECSSARARICRDRQGLAKGCLQ